MARKKTISFRTEKKKRTAFRRDCIECEHDGCGQIISSTFVDCHPKNNNNDKKQKKKKV